MTELKMSRFICLVMTLFPALWGIFSLWNDAASFTSTAEYAISPLLSMSDTYGNPWLTWRSIHAEWLIYLVFIAIVTVETLAGIFGFIGLIVMIKNFNKPYSQFSKGKAWAMLGASCAILVWGVGFMVIAGDWFMAWQAKENPLSTQLGGLIYSLPSMIAAIVLITQKE